MLIASNNGENSARKKYVEKLSEDGEDSVDRVKGGHISTKSIMQEHDDSKNKEIEDESNDVKNLSN